jgi:hypothetical protein
MKIKLNTAESTLLKDALVVYMDKLAELADADDQDGLTFSSMFMTNTKEDADTLLGRIIGTELGEVV